jgi:hypothetical protein
MRLVGLVASGGGGAGRIGQGAGGRPDEPWTFRIELTEWRDHEGRLVETPLRLTAMIPDAGGSAAIQALYAALEPETIVAVVVDNLDVTATPSPTATLVSVIGRVTDDPFLNARLEAARVEVAFDDPVVGRFVLDRRLNWFTHEVRHHGHRVRRTANTGSLDVARAIAAAAAPYWSPFDGPWLAQLRGYAAASLSELAEDWRDQDEQPEPWTRDAFQATIRLESITVTADGSYEVFFDDGGIFAGHVIIVSGTFDGGPADAQIAG